MNISVISTAQQAKDIDFHSHIAVVIDVLRATSVITTALENGARCVIPVRTVEEAQQLYEASNPAQTFRGGERHALKIEGFELDNSPMNYQRQVVEGKEIIITTTNGTQAIQSVQGADTIVLACLRNVRAVAEHLLKSNKDIVIVCAGTEGRFSLDDGLCAGGLLHLLKEKTTVESDDLGILLERFFRDSALDPIHALKDCLHVKRLLSVGFDDDVAFCLQTSVSEVVPIVRDGKVMSAL